MKRFGIALGILVFLAAAGLAIFAATFDADRYRPLAERKLSEALGRPVTIERIEAKFFGGAAVEVRGLAVWSGPDKKTRSIELERALVTAKLLPLLKKRVEIGSLELTGPKARVVRKKDGTVRVVGVDPPDENAPDADGGGAADFSVSSVRIRGGEFEFVDLTREPPLELSLRQTEVVARGIAPGRPASFEASAAFASANPNVRISGRVVPPAEGAPVTIESLKFDFDASAIDPRLWETLAPGLGAHLREAPSGKLSAGAERFTVGEKPEEATAVLRLDAGRVSPLRLTVPVEDIQLRANLDRGDAALESFSARVGGGGVQATGLVKNALTPAPESQFAVKIDRLPLDVIAVPGGAAKVRGYLSGAARAQSRGKGEEALRTLSAEGLMRLDEGVILDLNVVRTVLEKLSMIPGVGQKLAARLPDEYRARIDRPHTPLGPVEVPFRVQNGRVFFERLELRSDQFAFFARGSAGFDGSVSLEGAVLLDSNFSEALARSVEELRLFMNARGQIEVPVRVERAGGRLTVTPDTRFVASTLAAGKGQELIGSLLQGKLGGNAVPAQDQQAQEAPGLEQLFADLFSDD